MITPVALYNATRLVVAIAWFFFAAIFILRRRHARAPARRVDSSSITGIILQMLAFVVVGIARRKPGTAILPLGFWFHLLTFILVVVLVVSSLWLMSAAVRALGKQWSLQARVLETHELIRDGPYRLVRHPIYTGMLGMLVAAGLACSHWLALVIAIALLHIGTAIRVRSEEKLLREQFGAALDAYVRETPAILPRLPLRR